MPGKMKLETANIGIQEFAGTRAKQYAFKSENSVEKKNKGIKKSVVKREIRFEDYKETVLKGSEMFVEQNTIRSHKHNLVSETLKKKALCPNDDTSVILGDRVSTVPIGYKR